MHRCVDFPEARPPAGTPGHDALQQLAASLEADQGAPFRHLCRRGKEESKAARTH